MKSSSITIIGNLIRARNEINDMDGVATIRCCMIIVEKVGNTTHLDNEFVKLIVLITQELQ